MTDTNGVVCVETGMDVEECQFMWIINNFDVVKAKVQNLQEQLVILDGKAGETWHLELIPDLADKRCFHVRCTLVKKSVPDVSSICAIWSLQIQFSDTETFFRQRLGPNDYAIGESKTSRDICFSMDTPSQTKPGSSLIVHAGLQTYTAIKDANVSKYSPKMEKSLDKLSTDLVSLLNYNEDNFFDVKILLRNGAVLQAHQVILAARSPVFDTMLRTDMQEAMTGVIHCDDICEKAMKALLHYMYSGNLHEDWSAPDVICDFTLAAHKYQLQSLVEFLDENLAKVCTINSACELLVLVRTLGLKIAEEELMIFVKDCIRKAPIQEISDLKKLASALQPLID